jgi:hypothetical protein
MFVVALCAGMGLLIDMAFIDSATRSNMHTVRANPRELMWRNLARWAPHTHPNGPFAVAEAAVT